MTNMDKNKGTAFSTFVRYTIVGHVADSNVASNLTAFVVTPTTKALPVCEPYHTIDDIPSTAQLLRIPFTPISNQASTATHCKLPYRGDSIKRYNASRPPELQRQQSADRCNACDLKCRAMAVGWRRASEVSGLLRNCPTPRHSSNEIQARGSLINSRLVCRRSLNDGTGRAGVAIGNPWTDSTRYPVSAREVRLWPSRIPTARWSVYRLNGHHFTFSISCCSCLAAASGASIGLSLPIVVLLAPGSLIDGESATVTVRRASAIHVAS